jgi:stage V sporulation protein R
MVETAALNAERIARYEYEHGLLAVERFLDAVLSVKEHFGMMPGLAPEQQPVKDEPRRSVGLYDDLWELDGSPSPPDEAAPRPRFPEVPERDLLGFIVRHARDLEDWQRDIVGIVRQEMLYFLPQMQTKIINEGWAVLWHQRIMNELDLTPSEHAQFGRLHASVVSPGGRMRINPYYVGYKVLLDIERRWNDPTDEERRRFGRQPDSGLAKLYEVRESENDQSLLRKYLTADLVRDLDLYTYRLVDDEWQVAETDWEVVRDTLVRSMDNFGMPTIVVEDADYNANRELYLRHRYDGTELDIRYAEKTLQYLHVLWGRTVHVETVIDERPVRLTYDGRRNSKVAL